MEKFEVLWKEHIDGFKKRKLPKSQTDVNMEWRVRLREKEEREKKLKEALNKTLPIATETSPSETQSNLPPSESASSSVSLSASQPKDGKTKKSQDADLIKAREEAVRYYQAMKKQKLQGGGTSSSKPYPRFVLIACLIYSLSYLIFACNLHRVRMSPSGGTQLHQMKFL